MPLLALDVPSAFVSPAVAVAVAVDFAAAGKNLTGPGANKMFMLPPKLNDAEQTAITNAGVVSGAVIYNTTDNKLRVYNGTAWRDLH